MAWRVLQSGATLDIVQGQRTLPNGTKQDITATVIGREGQILRNANTEPAELESTFVERYDAGEEVATSLVERVEVSKDDDGNEVVTPATARSSAAAGGGSSSGGGSDEGLKARVRELEEELKAAKSSPNYDKLSPEALQAEADKRGVAPQKGSGKDGNVVKSDLVQVLEEDDAKS